MSGGMGYYDGGMYEDPDDLGQQGQQVQNAQQKNPLRDHLKRVEDQNTALQTQLAQLLAKQRQTEVADALQAKGYDRGVAGLYEGEPAKLDEWLTSYGPLLSKQSAPTSGEGAAQQGQAPASTVPADGQAQMQQLQQLGGMAAPPSGSDAEQMAQIRNAQSPEALMQYLQGQGNPHYFNGS
jgi:hypothetical protein